MSFRLEIDATSVLLAATSVQEVGRRLDGAPAGAALRTVAAALPGSLLGDAAAEEAAEWAKEMSSIAEVFQRYTKELKAAVEAQRRLDASGAAGLRAAR